MINIWDPKMTMRYILAVAFQMARKNIGPGIRVAELERKLAELCGKKYAVATSSGTTALMLAIMSLKMDRRKTILFPAYTNLAGANAAKLLGHKVRLVDIREETLCMDPEKMDLKGVGAVIFVNHNAYVGEDVQNARLICDDCWHLPMIEDSAQAIGLLGNKDYGPGSVGGLINTLSFSVPKLVTAGQGGAVLTDDEAICLMVKSMRDQGMDLRSDRLLRWHARIGGNFRMTDMQAAYCLAQLRIINSLLARRKRVQDWYSERIPIYRFSQPSVWLPIYRARTARSAQKIIDELKDRDIAAARLYLPINMQKEFATRRKFKNAAKASMQCVYLPGSLNLKENQVGMICEIVKGVDGE